MSASSPPVALIVGVGEGLGYALGKRFAAAGFKVALAARNAERIERLAEAIVETGGQALALPADARDERAVIELFERLEREQGPIEVVAFNAGAMYRSPIAEMPADMFEEVWRAGCYAGLLVGREAARRMAPRGRGTILFTGATASLRGGARFAAFAAAKHGLRALAQSMARELGPNGHSRRPCGDRRQDRRAERGPGARAGRDRRDLLPHSRTAALGLDLRDRPATLGREVLA